MKARPPRSTSIVMISNDRVAPWSTPKPTPTRREPAVVQCSTTSPRSPTQLPSSQAIDDAGPGVLASCAPPQAITRASNGNEDRIHRTRLVFDGSMDLPIEIIDRAVHEP